MRKVFFSIVALSGLALVSCKKEYTCECKKIYTGSETTVSTNADKYTFKDSRVRAEDKCNDKETSGSDIVGSYTVECQIK